MTRSTLSDRPAGAGLARLWGAELALSGAAAAHEGLLGLVRTAGELTERPQWLLDAAGRLVTCTPRARDFAVPSLELLLAVDGRDRDSPATSTVPARPSAGLSRRHLLAPAHRRGVTHAWWVVAELPHLFDEADQVLATRTAHHLATEYDTQRRVARAAWNARSLLARQLVRGSGLEDDLVASGEYLGVDVESRRLVVFLSDPDPSTAAAPPTRVTPTMDEARSAARLASALGVEVLGTRGNEGTVLLVEAPTGRRDADFVHEVKHAVRRYLLSDPDQTSRPGGAGPAAAVGISPVTDRHGLRRSYREAREVARCVERFSAQGERILAVDDLGPARLFVANARDADVRAYVTEVLGTLLTGHDAHRALLATLQSYFDHDRSIRATARALAVHENTIRLRLGRVRDLTGLDVAARPNDQLTVQTALLVLQLTGTLEPTPTRRIA